MQDGICKMRDRTGKASRGQRGRTALRAPGGGGALDAAAGITIDSAARRADLFRWSRLMRRSRLARVVSQATAKQLVVLDCRHVGQT
jgi:hypothetical protein